MHIPLSPLASRSVVLATSAFRTKGRTWLQPGALHRQTQEQETPGRGGGGLSGVRWGQVCPGTRSVRSGCGYKWQTLHTPHQRLEQSRARGQGCRVGRMIWRASLFLSCCSDTLSSPWLPSLPKLEPTFQHSSRKEGRRRERSCAPLRRSLYLFATVLPSTQQHSCKRAWESGLLSRVPRASLEQYHETVLPRERERTRAPPLAPPSSSESVLTPQACPLLS